MNNFYGGNLFWGMQFRTCKNFWAFADLKSSLTPKNSYKYKSHTAITSIVVAFSHESKINPIVILSVAKYPFWRFVNQMRIPHFKRIYPKNQHNGAK